MTLPSSGSLSFSQIEAEFGSNGNRSMSRYRSNSIHFSNKTVGDLGRITEDGILPLDRWFGTLHDGSEESFNKRRSRLSKKNQEKFPAKTQP